MSVIRVAHLTSVHTAMDPRIFRKECRALARAGFDVTLVAPHTKDTIEELVRIKSVKKHSSRLARMTRTVWSVLREAQRLNADIYHFHDPELIPVGLILRGEGRRVIYDVHEDFPLDVTFKSYLPGWSRRVMGRLIAWAEAIACKRFSGIVSVTPRITERMKAFNSNTVTVYNYPYPEELMGQEMAPWESRGAVAAYVGTITPQRGIAQMVQAMGYVADSLPATLEIAGDRIPEEVKKLPGWSRVKFHGALDQPSVYRLLRKARVGLIVMHPIKTIVDSIPVKIFEYMGAGIPVIASDFPLWRQILGSVGCAIFVDPMDPRAIARAIEYVLANPAQAEEMGRRGQAAVTEQFNWNTQARKLVSLYSSLMDSPCAG